MLPVGLADWARIKLLSGLKLVRWGGWTKVKISVGLTALSKLSLLGFSATMAWVFTPFWSNSRIVLWGRMIDARSFTGPRRVT